MTTDHTIPVLRKALAVLQAVASPGGPRTTKAIAGTLGLSPSTTYRILQTFLAENWLRPAEEGRHELSFGLLPILEPLVLPEVLTQLARDPLRELAGETGLATKLSVRDGVHAVTVFRARAEASASNATGLLAKTGDSTPLVVGAAGAALLSGLEPGRRRELIARSPRECWRRQRPEDVTRRLRMLNDRGYCVDVGGYRPDVAALSVPLTDAQGRVLAAFTLVGTPAAIAEDTPGIARRLISLTDRCRSLLNETIPSHHDLRR